MVVEEPIELDMEDAISLFQSIGLSEAKAKDTLKNAAVSNSLKSLIVEVHSRNNIQLCTNYHDYVCK